MYFILIMTLRKPAPCWGIGLARTGTTTFCEALTLLGYERVRHNPRFEELERLDGGADNGVTAFYKYLDYKFPGSRFVLTMREKASWLASMQYILEKYPVHTRSEDIAIMRRMHLYETVSYDHEKLGAAYDRHIADVRRYFAQRPADILEMDVAAGDGWKTLCPFLGLPSPDAAFPHLNMREHA